MRTKKFQLESEDKERFRIKVNENFTIEPYLQKTTNTPNTFSIGKTTKKAI